jgi:uncharacterized protein
MSRVMSGVMSRVMPRAMPRQCLAANHRPPGARVSDFAPDLNCTLSQLFVHPIKSCGGLDVQEALLIETGLEFDRAWMVVDAQGEMITQRDEPRLALMQPTLRSSDMVLRAPGMLALHIQLDTVEAATRAQVWDDIVKAYDMGALAAQWVSDFLKRPARLVRFDPEETRLSDPAWAGDVKALNAFGDGFPLLVANSASLQDVNDKLVAKGLAPILMQRFRPNLVLDGLKAFDEDHIDLVEVSTDNGPVTLRLVKPCGRCIIPNVNPTDASTSNEPGDTLASYRADARVKGAVTFAMNAVVVAGFEHLLRVGQSVRCSWKFE